MLFNKTRQYNMPIFNKIMYFMLGQHKSKLQKQKSQLFMLIGTAARVKRL